MGEPYTSPPVENHSRKPPGVLPKNLQKWLIAGIAGVMMLVIAFSGGNAPSPRTPAPLPGAAASDPNAARIQEYRARIEQQLQRLAQEQSRLAQEQGAVIGANAPASGRTLASTPLTSAGASLPGYSSAPDTREKSWIEVDRQKRQYESRYASSVALTHRKVPTAPVTGSNAEPAGQAAREQEQPSSRTEPALTRDGRRTYRILEGTVIETVLTNRLDGSFSGPVNCMVTTAVYSQDRRHVLIPQGSRVLGSVRAVDAFGQQRLAVSFHRLITPDGVSVDLNTPPGLSQVGETGLLDQVNRHYGQIFGVSLAIGAIAGLSQLNTQSGANASGVDLYRQGVAGSLSQTSLNILDRYLNVLPTFTVREGHRIKVYLTGDLMLPAAPTSASPRSH